MSIRSALAAMLIAAPLGAAASETPLLDYALTQQFEPSGRDVAFQQRARRARHALELHPPPAENCAQTLGASRFAGMYDTLGQALEATADYGGAVEAYRSALRCSPRSTYLHGPLAAALMYLGRYGEAREVAERGNDTTDSQASMDMLIAQLDYIDERWADAIRRLRMTVGNIDDDDTAAYWQCLLWLAQRRSGIAHPELVSRDDPQGWPRPVLDFLIRDRGEAALVSEIVKEKDDARRREVLTEALFYVGEHRLAEADSQTARRYMAATVNLKVHYFIEHHLARAELARLGPETIAQD